MITTNVDVVQLAAKAIAVIVAIYFSAVNTVVITLVVFIAAVAGIITMEHSFLLVTIALLPISPAIIL